MKYMLLIYMEENAMSESERANCYVKSSQLAHELHSAGQLLATAPLHPISTATSVRVRDGKLLITDGPFAETREQLGGFYLVDVPNEAAAVSIAERIPGAQVGTVEVRPVHVLEGLPPQQVIN